MVKIKSGIDTATIRGNTWECDSLVFLDLLTAITENNFPPPSHPWQEYRMAEIIIERLGGEIIEAERGELPEGDDIIF